MQIIIVGCGKVGYTIAKSLSSEKGVDLTLIDIKAEALDKASESIDAMLITGNGLNANTLIDAGVKGADLLISVTNADETNMLCCISAKHLGIKHTIARVRNPDYALELNKFWKDLGLDMIINPEQATAREISRLLRFPTVDDIDTFVGGRVELVSFNTADATEYFLGKSVAQIFYNKRLNILLATVERKNAVIIPHGEFIFEKGDIIRVLGRPSDIMNFFSLIGRSTDRITNAVIIGGSKITHYLVEFLHRHSSSTKIKIVEKDRKKCEALSANFARCLIINGDGADEHILSSEVIDRTGAVVCLTDRDEENTVIALYSHQLGVKKIILKINYINKNMVKNLGLGSIVSPQNTTSDQILQYVRGLANAMGSEIKTIYNIFENGNDRVEAVEFNINQNAKCLNKPIKDLRLKKGILIGCIVRNTNIIIPSGESSIHLGDSVIIISKNDTLSKLDDILVNQGIGLS